MNRFRLIFCCVATLLATAFSGNLHAQLSDVTQPGDPIVGTSNNTPGSEGVANAIDNAPTKYLNFDRLNTGFTVTPAIGLSVVQGLTLTSANDAPERDPSTYTLEGSYDGVNFTPISSGTVPAFTARFQKNTILFDNATPYLSYRLVFPEVAGPGGNSMQISEVELLGSQAPSDVTQPGDAIAGTSNNTPGSEGVANAIDNAPTKYLNFDRLNTGFTVTPSVGGTKVTGITLTSANDAPERDPLTYTLEGSLDGVEFFPISNGSVPAFTARFQKNFIFFSNDRAFSSYRLVFPEVAGPGGNSMQISEVELLGVVSEVAQDVTQPGDAIVASSNNSPGSEAVANAIDNAPTKYLNFDRVNTGFTVTPGSGLTIVSGLTLTSANDAPERDPLTYTLEGSYDGVTFAPISSGSVPAFAARFQKNTILFANKVPYLSYRVIFPEVAGPGGNSMQISEVELLGNLAPTDVTVPGDPTVATSNNSPGSEGVANAIDNAPTKYLNFDIVNTGFTVTPAVGDTVVSGLTLTSANDAPDRDPADYTLEGSLDGTTFFPISSGTVPAFPTRFFKNYIFFPENNRAFKTYRLIFPNTQGNSTCCMQIAEVEFLGVTPGAVNTNAVDTLIRRQPLDTPVLLGQTATFRVVLTGPWSVQWFKNGDRIPGANNASYTTPAATAADDGATYYAVVQGRDGRQVSDEVMLSIFTPSTTESLGFSFRGGGANGAPTDMLASDITGFHPQAYWNNLSGGNGGPISAINSANTSHSTITVSWATSGEWGAGTGNSDPTERMLNGLVRANTAAGGSTITLSGVPQGNHSLLLYAVQVPLEFWPMDIAATAGGATQQRFIRPLNSDEYNPTPGFSLVSSTSAATRGVGNYVRFDNVQPGADGVVTITFSATGGGGQGPGLNGFQLLLNPPAAGEPPVITRQPASANGIAGGCVTMSVEASGPGLSYQWLKNGQQIAGATGPTLTLAGLTESSAGSYNVVVSNPAGRARSRSAVVEVLANSQIASGLITHLKFDETEGRTIANSVAGGQAAELRETGFENWQPGQVANSHYFEGNIYAFVPNYTKASRALTVSAWVNSASDNWGPIINNWIDSRTTGSKGQFQLEVVQEAGGPTLRGELEVGPNRVAAAGVIDGSLNTWHHVALTANGGTLSLYWDGRLVASADYLGNINSSAALPWLTIGTELVADPNDASLFIPSGTYFVGALDDVALWNRSLSEVEVAGLYNGGLAGQTVSAVPPVLVAGDCRPTIDCPNNLTVEASGNATPVSFVVTGADAAGAPLIAECVPASGSGFAVGQTTVTCTVTASPGNSVSCSFRVTVADTAIPTITCPGDIATAATGEAGAVVTYEATASDAGGIASLVCVPASGSTFALGETPVTCTATDNAGNTASCSFKVTVRPSSEPPTAVIGAEALVDFSPDYENPVLISCNWWNACLVLDGWTSSAADGGALTYLWFDELEPVPFDGGPVTTNCYEVGTHTITLIVTDSRGLTDSDSKTIEVVTAPLAIELLIEKVNQSRVTRAVKRELVASLRAALNSAKAEKGRPTQTTLDAFEKKVRAKIAEAYPEEARVWIKWSQAVSTGIEKCIKPPRKAKDHWDKKKADDK
ncbi:MAG: HYR domain-containing protein [Verrucomicrobia bacterium]|nr:HYR domain-containing protein [Verrucomicrobiota bacterium]